MGDAPKSGVQQIERETTSVDARMQKREQNTARCLSGALFVTNCKGEAKYALA
jgi:hypothetical protein